MAKIYRVKKVTSTVRGSQTRSQVAKKAKVSVKEVSGFIFGGLILDIIILCIWYGTDPFTWTVSVVSRDSQDFILQALGQCSSEGDYAWVYPMVIVILHLALLVYANVLAFQTRNYHKIRYVSMYYVHNYDITEDEQ